MELIMQLTETYVHRIPSLETVSALNGNETPGTQ
jgi:hypothetical protein